MTGSFLQRLSRLEQLLPITPTNSAADELLVPVAVADYLASMNAARWYDRATLSGVVATALPDGPVATLLALQSWILRIAWVHLADWWGQDAAGWHQPEWSKRTAAGRNFEVAASELFAIDAGTLHRGWTGADEPWLLQWRAAGTTDPQILEHAGLHAAELALLGAEEEHA